jgi:two-component system phosphate regulon response regulator PhoB/two-component system alkaline phosphatase synthesis response regulator PhoP
MQKLIYIVEDETDILELVALKLQAAGYETKCFEKATPMLEALKTETPSLIVLDLMLPDLDGMEACKQIKGNPATEGIPILMLTARVEIEDRVQGLELGADDYVTKPFDSKELIARVRAILRRASWETAKNELRISENFKLDFNRYEAFLHGKRIDLTLTEFKILQLLTKRPGWVYSRSMILDYLWGNDKIVIERTVDVHIKNLRDKIDDYSTCIVNVRGVGYKFEPPEDSE